MSDALARRNGAASADTHGNRALPALIGSTAWTNAVISPVLRSVLTAKISNDDV